MSYVITLIAQAKKNTERVNIFLNGKFWLGLGKNDLISLKLTKGTELSDLEKEDVERRAFNGKLIDRAINYMQIRPRSSAEVRDYLVLRKKIDKDDVENVISHLQEKGLLSDEKFAKWYADYKFNSGINGANKIKAELIKKRVDVKIINSVLEKLNKNQEFKSNQLVKIEEFVKKVRPTIKAKDAYELKTKLINRLMSRGFKYDEIKKVVK